jgi:acetyltransferase-like isoleucine patch superfamily enzyme
MIDSLESRYLDEHELSERGIADVGDNVRVSEHATIVGLSNVSLGSNIRIDSHVVILSKRGKFVVGDNVHIEPSASIVTHFGVFIGDYCTISHGVRLYTASADYSGEYFTNVFPDEKYQVPKAGQIILKDHVIIGGNSVVMPSVTLHEGSAIGALSFVRQSVDGWSIYGGNPLRRIGDRSQKVKVLASSLS